MAEVPYLHTIASVIARSVSDDRIPTDILDTTRDHVLDTVGVCLAATELETSKAISAYAVEQAGAPQAHAFGVESPLPASTAALVNGTLAHSLDFDDTHFPSVLHPSATIIPACLAAAEAGEVDGARFLSTVTVGLEVCVRLGMAGYDRANRNSTYFDRGQHATSICGAIGAAGAIAAMMGGDESEVVNSMAIATSMASGIIESNRAGGNVKRLHCGWAAHSAVVAAGLARRGFTGPPTALEGRFGFFQAFLSGSYEHEELTAGLGETWRIPEIRFKPYPANHFTHAGIDAALSLRTRGVRLDDVADIRLGVAGPTARTIGEPPELKRQPATGYQAQFSGPYTVVAALAGGTGLGLGLDDFTDELAQDPERRLHMAKVSVFEDERCTRLFPDEFPAILEVHLNDGRVERERIDTNRGGPARPLSADELVVKFNDNAGRALADRSVSEVHEAILALSEGAAVSAILLPARMLSPSTA